MKILMCRPKYFGIFYEINPWMDVSHPVIPDKPLQQWNDLYQALEQLGAEIALVDPVPDLPDLTFTANAGLVYDNAVYLSHFLHPERQREEPYYYDWFHQAGYKVLPQLEHYFEGAGDALFAGDTLFVGYGIRSAKQFYSELVTKYPNWLPGQLVECELVDPYFYHLDTCFCPLNSQQALWIPKAFSTKTQQRMQQQIELWPVPEDEARKFACNAVVLGNDVVLPADCQQTQAYLESRGYSAHACDMSEFLKAGGACKCLTLVL